MRSSATTRPAARQAAARPGARRKRERARRCADVLAAARRLFARKGYRGTTMVEIARAADFALATLYQLFPSKDAILRGLLEEQVDGLLDRARAAAMRPGDAVGRLRAVVRAQLAFFEENPDVLRLYLSGWSGYVFTIRQDFGPRIDARYRRHLALLAAILAEGIGDGRVRREAPERLALALAGMLNALIRAWLEDDDVDLAAEGEAMLRIFLDGVRAHRGHA